MPLPPPQLRSRANTGTNNIASITRQYLSDPERITRMGGNPVAYLESII